MDTNILTYKSNGKFLITAEYLILKGGIGLALPLKRGQTLTIKKNDSSFINWQSTVKGSAWFECKLQIENLSVISTTNEEISNSLVNVLQVCKEGNPQFLISGVDAVIDADFNLAWGLGSSSTLINNVANWANINPYQLLEKTFGGSGYDIACAGAKGAITYQLTTEGKKVNDIDLKLPFSNEIFFVYLGKKMNSRTGMSYFKEHAKYGEKEINEINSITNEIISSQSIHHFEVQINKHEKIMSEILQMPTIKESTFANYPRSIKSMGAWGGDFVLVTGNSLQEVSTYFHSKGLDTIIPYKDLVL